MGWARETGLKEKQTRESGGGKRERESKGVVGVMRGAEGKQQKRGGEGGLTGLCVKMNGCIRCIQTAH